MSYIVIDEYKNPMRLGVYENGEPTILQSWGDTATNFISKRQAENAITRSGDYAKKHNLGWETDLFEIVKLVSPKAPRWSNK